MRRMCSFGIAVTLLAGAPVGAQTLNEVLAKHVRARGGMAKIKGMQTARMTGRMTMAPGMEAPFVLEVKRPNKMRLEFTIQGMTGVQAYDGTTAWMRMPFMGKADPQLIPEDQARELADGADVDGPLIDYKAKGHTVELLGKDKVEGTDAYKLKVVLKGGREQTIYLEAESFLEFRTDVKRTIRGTATEAETVSGDYKEVDGLVLPHSIEVGAKGSPERQKLTLDKIELNVPVDDSRFVMPAPAPEPTPTPTPTPQP